ncbi:MAG: Cl- channel voltage-gated family protein [Acidobacteria bacterium]|nr:MAG: Cl- channel voltage-gated family protein [Acidobacteriota bacterium]
MQSLYGYLKRFKIGNTTFFLSVAALVGLLSGIGNIVFVEAVEHAHWFFFDVVGNNLLNLQQGGWHRFLIILLPVSGALLLIPLAKLFPGLVNGYGFPKFLAEVHLKLARISPLRLIANTLGAAITIGSGGSAGREGPIGQIGGTIGSVVARWLKLSTKRTQVLVGCGAAGAIAATFNAPIAGVLFAEEIVFLGEMKLNTFSLFVISSAIATAVSRTYYGAESIFHTPNYIIGGPMEFPLYALLGILIGIFGALYKRGYYTTWEFFNSLRIPKALKPVLGAFLVGIIGIFMRDVLSDGYDVIRGLINGNLMNYSLLFLGLLVLGKILATSLTLGSGGAGGMFAPSLFVGAALGAFSGKLFALLFPAMHISAGAYAVVAMGAFLSSATHAPLMSIFLLTEITGNYSVMLPIMIASIIGTTVSQKLFHDSIDTHYFTLKKIPIERARETAALHGWTVGDIMDSKPTCIYEGASLQAFVDGLNAHQLTHLPVTNKDNKVVGILSISDVKSFMFRDDLWRLLIVSDIMRDDVTYLSESDDILSAQEKFDFLEIEDLPVLDEDKNLRGVLTRNRLTQFIRKKTLEDRSYEASISEL